MSGVKEKRHPPEPGIVDLAAYQRIKRARNALILKHPFFASLALRLKVQEDQHCRTAWTDGTVFAYNPSYVSLLSAETLEGLTAHVVMHLACNHHLRRQNRAHDDWNRACDYVINGLLLEAGFTLPEGYLYREDFAEQSAESVYAFLLAEKGESSEEKGEGDEEPEDGESNEEDQEQEGGSGSAETSEEGEEGGGDPGMSGEVRDAEGGVGQGEPGEQEMEWNDAVVRAALHARSMGQLPSGVERMINRRIRPQLPWQELLERFIDRSSRSDYSWIVPNRRYLHADIYLPSLKNCDLGHVVVAVDTSGSIQQDEMEMFAAEITSIFSRYPASVQLIYCDSLIQGRSWYERCDLPITITPRGGGGTDYRPVFAAVEREGTAPSCLIYLTDMECISYPQHEPNYPVLWVKTGTSPRRPPFGELIQMSPEY